MTGGHVMTLET